MIILEASSCEYFPSQCITSVKHTLLTLRISCFNVEKRGFIRGGYWADLVLADLKAHSLVSKDNIISKCGWSPFEGYEFKSAISHTIVSGNLVYENGKFIESGSGRRLKFT